MTASRAGENGEIRRVVVEEVQNQLLPLRQAVESQGRTLRSLYSNGSGGPPGYLEKARDEDKDWKNQMFAKLDGFLSRLDKVEDFVVAHNAMEEQLLEDKKELNRRLNIKLVVGGLILSIVSLVSGNMRACKDTARSYLTEDMHQPTQNATK